MQVAPITIVQMDNIQAEVADHLREATYSKIYHIAQSRFSTLYQMYRGFPHKQFYDAAGELVTEENLNTSITIEDHINQDFVMDPITKVQTLLKPVYGNRYNRVVSVSSLSNKINPVFLPGGKEKPTVALARTSLSLLMTRNSSETLWEPTPPSTRGSSTLSDRLIQPPSPATKPTPGNDPLPIPQCSISNRGSLPIFTPRGGCRDCQP